MLKVSMNKSEDMRIELKVIKSETATMLTTMIKNILMNRLLFLKMREAFCFIFMVGMVLLSVSSRRHPRNALEHFAIIAMIRIAHHAADVRDGDRTVLQQFHRLLDPDAVQVFAESFFMVRTEIR